MSAGTKLRACNMNAENDMPRLRVGAPPMCRTTDVCGPSVAPELARYNANRDWLKRQGIAIQRFNSSQQPSAFIEAP